MTDLENGRGGRKDSATPPEENGQTSTNNFSEITVFRTPSLQKVARKFTGPRAREEAEAYFRVHPTMADCVAVDDQILMGWDEW